MKLVAFVLGAVFVAILALALWPRLRSPEPKKTSEPAPAAGLSDAPLSKDLLRATRNPDEQFRDELSEKRLPYFRQLRMEFSEFVEHFAVTEALDTLDIVLRREDPEAIQYLVTSAIGPSAKNYGFRKIRFLFPNPRNSVERFRVVAESAYDEAGRWNTFLK